MKRKAAEKANVGFLCVLVVLLGAPAITGAAQEACSNFSWPVETEIAWMTSPDGATFDSGAKLPGLAAKAIALQLKPSKEVTLPVQSGTKKPPAPDSYSGWLEIASLPKSGLYQVSLSDHGWIDVIQNGEPVRSQSFTGSPGCKAVRKSVRFELGAGPVTVEISGAPVETIKIAIREAN